MALEFFAVLCKHGLIRLITYVTEETALLAAEINKAGID